MKAFEFVRREFLASVRTKRHLPAFLAHRGAVRNVVGIYTLVSSFTVRIAARLAHSQLRRRFVPISVRYRSGLTLSYPLHAYLNHWQDLFEPYSKTYLAAHARLGGRAIAFQEGDVIVDIGAHIGTFTVPLAYEFPVRVVAVEPSRLNARYLRENVRRNGLDSRVTVVEQAVHGSEGRLEFAEGDATTRGTLTSTPFNRMDTGEKYDVTTTTFAALVRAQGIQAIKLLKVDCEGAEYELFYGMDEALFGMIEYLFVEIHRRDGRDPGALLAFLEARGFESRSVKLSNGCYEVFCSRLAVAA